MSEQAFFIVGVQRSGTTLLSHMLGKHPDILMEPRSIGFRIITCFKNQYELLPYNIQHDQKAFQQWLVQNDDKGRLAELIDVENINQYDNIRDLISTSINKKIERNNKQLWGDKSPNLQHFFNDLQLLIPAAKIIHIVRDGRANAYSMSTRSHKNLELAAQEWLDGNIYGLVNQEMIGKQQYMIIKYEKLLGQTAETLASICDFLEIPFSKKILDLSPTNDLSEEKQYVKTSIDKSKINTWKKELSTKEILKIEQIQGGLLEQLGYHLINDIEEKDFKPLSLRRRIWYNQKDNVKQIFRAKQIGMKQKENIIIHRSFRSRIYQFLTVFIRDLVALPIFKSLFSNYFYKEKYYKEEQDNQR